MNDTRTYTFEQSCKRINEPLIVAAYAALDDFGVFQDTSGDQRIRLCHGLVLAAQASLRSPKAGWKGDLLARLGALLKDLSTEY